MDVQNFESRKLQSSVGKITFWECVRYHFIYFPGNPFKPGIEFCIGSVTQSVYMCLFLFILFDASRSPRF